MVYRMFVHTTDYVETFKRFQRAGLEDPYTDEEAELTERDEKPNFVYAGEYVVGEGGADMYNEADPTSGRVANGAGEVCRLAPGERVVLTEGQCVPIRKRRDIDGNIVANREFGKLMLRYPGDWLCGTRGWIDPIGDAGEVCISRADGKPFEVELKGVDAAETFLQCEKDPDKILVDFYSLSRYMQVAKRNSMYSPQRFLWGMHEALAAATLFRACDTRFLGRIALVDLAGLCSQLQLDFTIEDLTGVWHTLADGYQVVSFAQFLEGTAALRTATGGAIHAHAIRKFRRLLLTHRGPGRSVDSMIASITASRSLLMHMASAVEADGAVDAETELKKDLVYVDGVGFRPKKTAKAEARAESAGADEEHSDAAADAAALAAKTNPNARKSRRSGNKWHEFDAQDATPRTPRTPRFLSEPLSLSLCLCLCLSEPLSVSL